MSNSALKENINGLPISINDIRDKYFNDVKLSADEKSALINFDKYRMDYLNSAPSEEIFEKRYLEIQAKGNLSSFTDFLDSANLKTD